MAGREIPPPPNKVADFGMAWRNWLYLVYRKVNKRTHLEVKQIIDGIGDGNPNNTMQEGLIGIAPVGFAQDSRRMDRNFSWEIPLNWVKGSNLEFGITFANTQAQTGLVSVVTEVNFEATSIGEDLSLAGTAVVLELELPNNVAANILHLATIVIIPSPDLNPGNPVQFEIARVGTDAADTCVGDVGYKEIAIAYDGFINHE